MQKASNKSNVKFLKTNCCCKSFSFLFLNIYLPITGKKMDYSRLTSFCNTKDICYLVLIPTREAWKGIHQKLDVLCGSLSFRLVGCSLDFGYLHRRQSIWSIYFSTPVFAEIIAHNIQFSRAFILEACLTTLKLSSTYVWSHKLEL